MFICSEIPPYVYWRRFMKTQYVKMRPVVNEGLLYLPPVCTPRHWLRTPKHWWLEQHHHRSNWPSLLRMLSPPSSSSLILSRVVLHPLEPTTLSHRLLLFCFLSVMHLLANNNAEVTLPHSCIPEYNFTSFTFWSTEVHMLLNELDSFSGTNPIGFFPQFHCSFLELWYE